jgi:hypothetical protein
MLPQKNNQSTRKYAVIWEQKSTGAVNDMGKLAGFFRNGWVCPLCMGFDGYVLGVFAGGTLAGAGAMENDTGNNFKKDRP